MVMLASLTPMIESMDTGELMVGKVVAMVQSALVPMDNVHQLVQEQHKKVLLQLHPMLKSFAQKERAFQNAAPMLFGKEFAMCAIDKVEVAKTLKKLSRP